MNEKSSGVTGVECPETYTNLQLASKNTGFYSFYCKKTVWRCKTHRGGWKFTKGAQLPQTPVNPHPGANICVRFRSFTLSVYNRGDTIRCQTTGFAACTSILWSRNRTGLTD